MGYNTDELINAFTAPEINEKKNTLIDFINQKCEEFGKDAIPVVFDFFPVGRAVMSYVEIGEEPLFIKIYVESLIEYKIETLKDAALHELAHYIVGAKHNHDKVFKDTAKDIGCKGYRAKDNLYFFDMYGRYDITKEEEAACFSAWFNKQKKSITV